MVPDFLVAVPLFISLVASPYEAVSKWERVIKCRVIAFGPYVASVIGSACAAGVLLGFLI